MNKFFEKILGEIKNGKHNQEADRINQMEILKECQAEISKVLEKFGCIIAATPEIRINPLKKINEQNNIK